jgi:hypothetical protein
MRFCGCFGRVGKKKSPEEESGTIGYKIASHIGESRHRRVVAARVRVTFSGVEFRSGNLRGRSKEGSYQELDTYLRKVDNGDRIELEKRFSL